MHNDVSMGVFLNVETKSIDGLELVWFLDKEGKINNVVKNDVTLKPNYPISF